MNRKVNQPFSFSNVPMKIQTRPRQTESVDGYIHSIESLGTVDGPGIRHVIFTQGCQLRCLYCHNPDSLQLKKGHRVASGKLLDEIQKSSTFLRSARGGVTISGGEPLVQPKFVASIFRGCKEMKLHTALDTNGYLGDQASDAMLQDIDLVLLDIKSFDPAIYRRVSGGFDLQPTLDFARRLESLGRKMWIRFVPRSGSHRRPGQRRRPRRLRRFAENGRARRSGTLSQAWRVQVEGTAHEIRACRHAAAECRTDRACARLVLVARARRRLSLSRYCPDCCNKLS